MTDVPGPAADALYELPPTEFVAARGALAKQLRADGDKAQAAVVAKLRRPTPGAYALNRVARSEPALVDAALAAGAALVEASDAALGGDASELRQATAVDREAVRALAGAAARHIGRRASDIEQQVTATVRAAVANDDLAAVVRAGRLEAEPDAADASMGLAPAFAAGSAGSPPARPTPKKANDELAPSRDARAAKVDAAVRAEAKRIAAEEAAARQEQRRREAEHRRRVAQLESKVRRLEGKATEAERVAADARADADAAAAELEDARAAGPEES
jgi:uncharacterized protein YhaN